MIGIVFSNPRHHAEILVPVARALREQHVDVRVVSLAELRGFRTPKQHEGVPLVRAIPPLRSRPELGSGGRGGAVATPRARVGRAVRTLAQRAAWLGLRARLAWLLRGCRVVVVPNDAAFPYKQLVSLLRDRGVPFVLVQEGVRFPLPVEQRDAYGAAGAARVCVWGDGAAAHFKRVGVPDGVLRVTGNPRFDRLDRGDHAQRGRAHLERAGIRGEIFVYLSNPIDDQGFCSNADKLRLFEQFARGSQAELQRRGLSLVVKLHPREDLDAFRAAAMRTGAPVSFVDAMPLFDLLAAAAGAVVLASTAGLEALALGVPLGVLPVPGHGHVFEYASSGAAVALDIDAIAGGVAEVLDGAAMRRPAADALVARHLLGTGAAAKEIARVVLGVNAS